jgi:retinol dehydrogenase-12
MQIYLVRHLASLYPVSATNVIINIVNPGFCKTQLSREAEGLIRVQFAMMKLLLGRTAEQGSRNLLFGVCAGEESHGMFLSDCAVKEYVQIPVCLPHAQPFRNDADG